MAAQRGDVRQMLEHLGLNANESRVVLALLELGSATPGEVAKHCELGRTNVYPVLEALQRKRLAHQLPGPRALWGAPGRDEVVDRLNATQAERYRAIAATADKAREALASLIPEPTTAPLPFVHRIEAPSQVLAVFNELLRGATDEVLLFDRPPYAGSPGNPNPAGIEMLERGVPCRALYQAGELADPRWNAYRAEQEFYIDLGLQARVVDVVPMKLLVVDRRVAWLALTQPGSAEDSYPTVLVIEHPGFAQAQAASFDALWSAARTYSRLGDPNSTIWASSSRPGEGKAAERCI